MNPELMKLARRSTGVRCPTCDHNVKVYHRNFNSGMARTLLYIYLEARRSNNEWLNVLHYCTEEYDYVAGEIGKLIWWGLVEKHSDKADDGNSNGMYRMTRKGAQFVKGKITIPEYATEYMSKVLKFDGREIAIYQAFDNNFDYNELMREAAA